jgi:hypothetical protein
MIHGPLGPTTRSGVAVIRGGIEQALYALTMEHLAKLANYVPGPVKKRGSRKELLAAYQQDPVFSIFGLDSQEYLGATLAGGTITSIHRKIGDIYEACVKTIFMQALGLGPEDVSYRTILRSGDGDEDRSADAYLLLLCTVIDSSKVVS